MLAGRLSRFAAWAAMGLIAGCASSGPPAPTTSAVPPALAAGDSRIYFYRETFHALSVQPEITVNGQVVGRAIPNGYFHVDRKPGTYEIATTAEPDRKLALTLESGQTRYVSLEFTVSWFLVAHINPVRVENAIAVKDIAGLHYMGN